MTVPKMNNKWTTIAGLVVLGGTMIMCIGQMMTGDFNAMECVKESWVGFAAGIGLLKASDGSL